MNLQVQRKFYGILLLLLCPLTALLIVYHPNDYAVSKIAHRLTKTSDRWNNIPLAGNLPYQWIDNKNIMVQSRRFGPTQIDTVTGGRVPLYEQDNKSQKFLDQFFGNRMMDNWVLSPDGKWILTMMPGHNFNWVLLNRELSNAMVIPSYPEPYTIPIIWWHDSKHWYRINYSMTDFAWIRYSTNLREPMEIIPIQSTGVYQNTILPLYEPIGETSNGELLCIRWGTRSVGYIEALLYEITPSSIRKNSKQYIAIPHIKSLPIPKGATLIETEISPDGNRLAWIFNFRLMNTSRVGFSIGKSQPASMESELWISDIDGKNMHPICINNDANEGPKAVRWMHDNQHVTFIYHNYLYEANAH